MLFSVSIRSLTIAVSASHLHKTFITDFDEHLGKNSYEVWFVIYVDKKKLVTYVQRFSAENLTTFEYFLKLKVCILFLNEGFYSSKKRVVCLKQFHFWNFVPTVLSNISIELPMITQTRKTQSATMDHLLNFSQNHFSWE